MPHLVLRKSTFVVACVLLVELGMRQAGAVEGVEPIQSTPMVNGYTEADFSRWGLTPEEKDHYLAVAKVEQAFSDISKLSPYEVLGKFAENDADRRRSAKRYIAAMVDNQRRSLEWLIAVADEIKKEDQGQKLLESDLIRRYLRDIGYKEPSQKVIPVTGAKAYSEKRLKLFVAANDCDSCDDAFKAAYGRLKKGNYKGIDVVFVGMKQENRKAATSWAIKNGITADMVNSREITLNVESEALKAIQKDHDVPVAIDSANGQIVSL